MKPLTLRSPPPPMQTRSSEVCNAWWATVPVLNRRRPEPKAEGMCLSPGHTALGPGRGPSISSLAPVLHPSPGGQPSGRRHPPGTLWALGKKWNKSMKLNNLGS